MSNDKPISDKAAPDQMVADAPKPPVRKMKEGWVSKLETLILGREKKDEFVDDSVTPGTTVDILFIPTIQGLVTFKVRADTSCRSIQQLLLANAQPGVKLEVIPGPKGGLRLGVNGKLDSKLNLMVKK